VDSWPLTWQIVVSLLAGSVGTLLVTALNAWLHKDENRVKRDQVAAETAKTEAERANLAADTAWEAVERLAGRVETLEERVQQREIDYEQLSERYRELRRKYDELLMKSQGQETRIKHLEEKLLESRERENALCALLHKHGIEPNLEVMNDRESGA